jgi:hypothetical protein
MPGTVPLRVIVGRRKEDGVEMLPEHEIEGSTYGGSDLAEAVAVFNHLFSFGCDISEAERKKGSSDAAAPSALFPVVFFQVYSVGSPLWSFDRHRLEGCGYAVLRVPLAVGVSSGDDGVQSDFYSDPSPSSSSCCGRSENDFTVKTWRPIGAVN